MFKFVHHVHYVVADVDAVVRYMEESFDMKPDHQEDVEDGGYREASYSAGQTIIEFTQPTKEGTGLSEFLATHGPGVYHVAWGVDNIEEKARELMAKGRILRGEGGITMSVRGYKAINIERSDSPGFWFQLAEG